MNIKAQLAKLHIYNVFFSLHITDAVWVVLLLGRGFTLTQVGVAEGVFHITGFLCEVPTGMAADLLGRKRTLAVSGVCGVLSAWLMAVSGSFTGVCCSMVFGAMMYNLTSGTMEAVAYDSLLMVRKPEKYLRVSAWLNGISSAVAAAGCLLGALAVWLGYFRAYMVNAALGVMITVSALSLTEPVVTSAQKARTENPFVDLLPRFWEHVRVCAAFLKHNPRTACKILADAGVAVPIYLSFMYLQQHLIDNGLPSAWLGVALLAIRMAGTAGIAVGAKLKRRLSTIVMVCAMVAGLGTMLAGTEGAWQLAVLGAALASFADSVVQLRVEVDLNHDFPSDQRATLISVNSMGYSMLMIVASPISGAVGNTLGTCWAFRVLGGALMMCAALFGILYRGRVKITRP